MYSPEEYYNKFRCMPKDYLERIAYIVDLFKLTSANIENLMNKVDQFSNKWEYISYVFYMEPKSTPRPKQRTYLDKKTNKKRVMFYVKDAKKYQDIFEEFMAVHSKVDWVISTPCRMDTKIYMETPKTMNKEEKLAAELELIPHISRPDWDNIGKTYSDMIQKALLLDDSLICDGRVRKYYSVLPRIEILLSFMTAYDSKFNRNIVSRRKSFKQNGKVLDNTDYII